jgi:predicted RNase H-like nuclease (RuvC/YqgF family)
MPSDRSVFWSRLDMFLCPRPVISPSIRFLQAQQVEVEAAAAEVIVVEGLEKRLREKGEEIERLERASAEQAGEIKRLKDNLTTQAAAAVAAAERLKKDLNKQAETTADEIKRLKDELTGKGEAVKSLETTLKGKADEVDRLHAESG